MTTVTTGMSETDKIKYLFAKAVEKTIKLVADIDGDEKKLLDDVRKLFETAVAAVVPVLKYVDEEIVTIGTIYEDHGKETRRDPGERLRGIRLPIGFILLRGGKFAMIYDSKSFPPGEIFLKLQGDDVEDQIAQIIEILVVLARKFAEALAKADEHRAKIAQRSAQLQKAAEAFQA